MEPLDTVVKVFVVGYSVLVLMVVVLPPVELPLPPLLVELAPEVAVDVRARQVHALEIADDAN